MARSIKQHYDNMSAEKDALTQTANLSPSGSTFSDLIADIKNNSRVAIWRLWLYVVAVGHWVNDKRMDEHTAENLEMLRKSVKGRPKWIRNWCLDYIDGASVQVIDGVPRYPENASGTQPVNFLSVREVGRKVYIYAAGEDANENRVPLASDVLDRFKAFVDRFELPGHYYFVYSLNPDNFTADIEIYFEAVKNKKAVKEAVNIAIQNHIQSLPSKGRLDGVLYLITLVDAIQEVSGVRDVVINWAKADGNTIKRKWPTKAGFMNYDKDNSTINMIAV